MKQTVLIIGCGYLGSRTVPLWQAQGFRVLALTRSREAELRQQGIEPVLGDVTSAESLRALPAVDIVLYAVGMDRSSGRSFREVYVQGLENVLHHLPAPKQFLYVSSTSVYGQTDGSEVTEDSPTLPIEENGKIVLEAESLLRSRLPFANILRFAGIYGPNRVIRKAAIERGEPLVADADKWLNLIHVEDGAKAVLAVQARGQAGAVYNIADDSPVRRRDFYTRMAELLQAPVARFQAPPADAPPLPHEGTNRRVVNRKLRQELAVELAYPSYEQGLPASIRG